MTDLSFVIIEPVRGAWRNSTQMQGALAAPAAQER